jgi:AcrR family transcriptional regulator
VSAGRRSDYMEALVDLAFERGYDAVGAADVAERAGGSVAEFESLFPSKLACAVATLEGIAESNLAAVRGAFDEEPAWPDSLRAAAYAHAEWVLDNPRKMHFGLLETVWASELTGALRDHLFGEYIAMVDAGREVAPDPGSIPAFTAEGVVGSITEVITRRLGEEQSRELIDLVPEMMYLAVRPYLGEEAARRELSAPRRAR